MEEPLTDTAAMLRVYQALLLGFAAMLALVAGLTTVAYSLFLWLECFSGAGRGVTTRPKSGSAGRMPTRHETVQPLLPSVRILDSLQGG